MFSRILRSKNRSSSVKDDIKNCGKTVDDNEAQSNTNEMIGVSDVEVVRGGMNSAVDINGKPRKKSWAASFSQPGWSKLCGGRSKQSKKRTLSNFDSGSSSSSCSCRSSKISRYGGININDVSSSANSSNNKVHYCSLHDNTDEIINLSKKLATTVNMDTSSLSSNSSERKKEGLITHPFSTSNFLFPSSLNLDNNCSAQQEDIYSTANLYEEEEEEEEEEDDTDSEDEYSSSDDPKDMVRNIIKRKCKENENENFLRVFVKLEKWHSKEDENNKGIEYKEVLIFNKHLGEGSFGTVFKAVEVLRKDELETYQGEKVIVRGGRLGDTKIIGKPVAVKIFHSSSGDSYRDEKESCEDLSSSSLFFSHPHRTSLIRPEWMGVTSVYPPSQSFLPLPVCTHTSSSTITPQTSIPSTSSSVNTKRSDREIRYLRRNGHDLVGIDDVKTDGCTNACTDCMYLKHIRDRYRFHERWQFIAYPLFTSSLNSLMKIFYRKQINEYLESIKKKKINTQQEIIPRTLLYNGVKKLNCNDVEKIINIDRILKYKMILDVLLQGTRAASFIRSIGDRCNKDSCHGDITADNFLCNFYINNNDNKLLESKECRLVGADKQRISRAGSGSTTCSSSLYKTSSAIYIKNTQQLINNNNMNVEFESCLGDLSSILFVRRGSAGDTSITTRTYRSPEIVQHNLLKKKCGVSKSDVYSIGIVLLEIFRHLFPINNTLVVNNNGSSSSTSYTHTGTVPKSPMRPMPAVFNGDDPNEPLPAADIVHFIMQCKLVGYPKEKADKHAASFLRRMGGDVSRLPKLCRHLFDSNGDKPAFVDYNACPSLPVTFPSLKPSSSSCQSASASGRPSPSSASDSSSSSSSSLSVISSFLPSLATFSFSSSAQQQTAAASQVQTRNSVRTTNNDVKHSFTDKNKYSYLYKITPIDQEPLDPLLSTSDRNSIIELLKDMLQVEPEMRADMDTLYMHPGVICIQKLAGV